MTAGGLNTMLLRSALGGWPLLAWSRRRPDRFYAKTMARQGLESWYDGKVLTIAVHQEKVF